MAAGVPAERPYALGLHEVARMKLRQRCCFCFRKSQTHESLSASFVHVLNKLTKASRPLPQGVVLPRPGRHQQQRVEDLVVQAGMAVPTGAQK